MGQFPVCELSSYIGGRGHISGIVITRRSGFALEESGRSGALDREVIPTFADGIRKITREQQGCDEPLQASDSTEELRSRLTLQLSAHLRRCKLAGQPGGTSAADVKDGVGRDRGRAIT